MTSEREQRSINLDDVYVTTESESRKRAAALPTTPSEDARHVLGEIELAEAAPWNEERDYLPEPAVSWIVDVHLEGNPRLNPQAVSDVFDKEWREQFGRFMAYGRDVDTGRWTYLLSADGPKAVDQLKFAFDYIDVLDEDALPPTERVYTQRLAQINERMKQFGVPTASPGLSPNEAAQRSQLLRELKQVLDRTVFLILEAPPGERFDGGKVWDAMLCLGLEWGDMDCFHWQNRSGMGDDSFFSVETTTPPGYFLPEQVAAGELQVDDLVFVYSVPRSAKPVEVFDAMARGVEYCRTRLGGIILDEEGEPANLTALRREIVEIVDQLRAAGFEPGADATLQLF